MEIDDESAFYPQSAFYTKPAGYVMPYSLKYQIPWSFYFANTHENFQTLLKAYFTYMLTKATREKTWQQHFIRPWHGVWSLQHTTARKAENKKNALIVISKKIR